MEIAVVNYVQYAEAFYSFAVFACVIRPHRTRTELPGDMEEAE